MGDQRVAPGLLHGLDVEHHALGYREHAGIGFEIERAVRVDQAGLAELAHFGEELDQKLILQRTLPARGRDALDIGRTAADLKHQLLHRHPADPGRGVVRADTDAAVAAHAFGAVPDDLTLRVEAQRPGGALFHTQTAAAAEVNRLGVVAEQAVEGAALKEDRCPVSRPVDIGEGNDPVNGCPQHPLASVLFCPGHERHPERLYRRR